MDVENGIEQDFTACVADIKHPDTFYMLYGYVYEYLYSARHLIPLPLEALSVIEHHPTNIQCSEGHSEHYRNEESIIQRPASSI